MHVIYSLSKDHVTQLHSLYGNEWWTNNRTLDETKSCIQGSQIVIGLTDENNTLAAFVRVITDFTFKALIFDLIVDKNFREKGLSRQLISLVKNHSDLTRVSHFELYCLPELKEFYQQFDFTDEIDGIQLLRYENIQ